MKKNVRIAQKVIIVESLAAEMSLDRVLLVSIALKDLRSLTHLM